MGRRSGSAGKDLESRVDAMPGTACLRGRRRRRRRGLGEGDTWEFEKMTAGILGDVLLLWKEEVVKKSNGHG